MYMLYIKIGIKGKGTFLYSVGIQIQWHGIQGCVNDTMKVKHWLDSCPQHKDFLVFTSR